MTINRTVWFDAKEILLLVSKIDNSDYAFNGEYSIADGLLLKLFPMFNALIRPDVMSNSVLPIKLTKQEAWLIRRKVSPFDRIDTDNIGIRILRKIHQFILNGNVETPFAEPPEPEPEPEPPEKPPVAPKPKRKRKKKEVSDGTASRERNPDQDNPENRAENHTDSQSES